jgi:glutathione S-transferase
MNKAAIVLYGSELSGHSHRVELLLRILGLSYRFVPAPAEIRRDAKFLGLNPLGQIPVLEDGEVVLADSNAIMVYLVRRYAPGSPWLPEEPTAAAEVQRWLSVAAGEIRYGAAVARAIAQGWMKGDRAAATGIALRILQFMNGHLADHTYLATDEPTIADLACYDYVAHAPEGGISLEPYPAVREWLGRVETLAGFFRMPSLPLAPPA